MKTFKLYMAVVVAALAFIAVLALNRIKLTREFMWKLAGLP